MSWEVTHLDFKRNRISLIRFCLFKRCIILLQNLESESSLHSSKFSSLCLVLLCRDVLLMARKEWHQSIQKWSVGVKCLAFVWTCSRAACWWLFTMLGPLNQALFMCPIKPHASRMWLAWNCLWTGLYCSQQNNPQTLLEDHCTTFQGLPVVLIVYSSCLWVYKDFVSSQSLFGPNCFQVFFFRFFFLMKNTNGCKKLRGQISI